MNKILYIIDNGFDGGSNGPPLADVQRHQPSGRQMGSPP